MNGFQIASGFRYNIDWFNMVISCVDTGTVLQFITIDCVIGRPAKVSTFPCGSFVTDSIVTSIW